VAIATLRSSLLTAAWAEVQIAARMWHWRVFVVGVCLAGISTWSSASRAADVPFAQPATRQAVLPNGLKVYLAEDHRVPLVALSIVYDVGIVDDPLEASGLARLIAKLLPGLGTRHLPDGTGRLIDAAGFFQWEVSAQAEPDRSLLRTLVPAAALDLALWTEADRMGFAADGLTDDLIREGSDRVSTDFERTTASGRSGDSLMRAAFGTKHPYNRLGLVPQLGKVTLGGLRDRLRTYYNPGAATLSLVGDFQSDAALAAIRRYFGLLPAARLPPSSSLPNAVAPAVHTVVPTLRAGWPTAVTGLTLGWITPRYFTDDDILLDLVACYLRHHIARSDLGQSGHRVNSAARQVSMRKQSYFWFYASLAPGQSRDSLRAEMRQTIAQVASGRVDESEFALAKDTMRRAIADDGDALLTRSGYLESCARMRGNPDCFVEHLAAYERASAQSLSEVARKYLLVEPVAELYIEHDESAPKEGVVTGQSALEGLAPAASPTHITPLDSPEWYRPPHSSPIPHSDLPLLSEAALPGGARLLFMARDGGPSARARISLNWRPQAPTPEILSLLSWLLKDSGVTPEDSLGQRLADLGATLDTSADEDSLVIEVASVPERLEAALHWVREALARQHFDAKGFKDKRDFYDKQLSESQVNDRALAERWRRRLEYPRSSAFHYAIVDSQARRAAFEAFGQKETEALWARERRLEHLSVAIVGPFSVAEAQRLGALALPNWPREPTRPMEKPQTLPPGVEVVSAETEGDQVQLAFHWPVESWGSASYVQALGLRWLSGENVDDGLGRRFEESGLKTSSSWYSNVHAQREGASLVLTFTVSAADVPAIFKGIAAHVARIEAGAMPWAAVQQARRETLQWVQTQFASQTTCMALLGSFADFALPVSALDDTYRLAQRMDRDSLAKAARLMAPARAKVIVYGRVPGLSDALRGTGFGPVSVVPILPTRGKPH